MTNKKIMGPKKTDGVTLMIVKRTVKWTLRGSVALIDCHNYMKCVFVKNVHSINITARLPDEAVVQKL